MSAPDALTNAAWISAARAALEDAAWDRLVGAAESETTALRNRMALDCIALRPRVLLGVETVDTSAIVLGHRLRVPVLLAHIGDPGVLWPGGGVAVMEAASRFGTASFVGPEAAGAAAPPEAIEEAPRILEVPAHDPPGSVSELVDSADRLGYAAVCLSLVPQHWGRREREPFRPRSMPRHTRDAWGVVANVLARGGLPLVVKGVMGAADARIAIDLGCAAVYVSNYGGRALDHCEATIDVLPEIVAAVDGRAEVIVDGGFMRGTDVVKAVASGATAVAIGRLQGLGLAAGGADGLVRVLEILEDELRVSMALLGATTAGALRGSHLSRDALPVQLPHLFSEFFRAPVG